MSVPCTGMWSLPNLGWTGRSCSVNICRMAESITASQTQIQTLTLLCVLTSLLYQTVSDHFYFLIYSFKRKANLAHLMWAMQGLVCVYWKTLRHARQLLLMCFPHFQKKNMIAQMWCHTYVYVGAEILSMVSVYFLNFMVLLETQMSSELNAEMAAPQSPTTTNGNAHTVPWGKMNQCPNCNYESKMAATGKPRLKWLEAGFKMLTIFLWVILFLTPYNSLYL